MLSKHCVTQVKSEDTDGYTAVQVTFGQKKQIKSLRRKPDTLRKQVLRRVAVWLNLLFLQKKSAELKVGDNVTVALFEAGQLVDVTGTSKGKGFSGTIKRHNFGFATYISW